MEKRERLAVGIQGLLGIAQYVQHAADIVPGGSLQTPICNLVAEIGGLLAQVEGSAELSGLGQSDAHEGQCQGLLVAISQLGEDIAGPAQEFQRILAPLGGVFTENLQRLAHQAVRRYEFPVRRRGLARLRERDFICALAAGAARETDFQQVVSG